LLSHSPPHFCHIDRQNIVENVNSHGLWAQTGLLALFAVMTKARKFLALTPPGVPAVKRFLFHHLSVLLPELGYSRVRNFVGTLSNIKSGHFGPPYTKFRNHENHMIFTLPLFVQNLQQKLF
jgi:hypothetical protein